MFSPMKAAIQGDQAIQVEPTPEKLRRCPRARERSARKPPFPSDLTDTGSSFPKETAEISVE